MSSIGDWLYAFTEWLRTTPLVEWSLWLSETGFSLLIQTNFWAIPTIQTIHIVAIAALFGSAVFVNLRVLGVMGMHQNVTQTIQRFRGWMRWGLIVLIVSGLLLIIGEPVRELINPVFWLKMALVPLAVIATSRFHRRAVQIDATGSASASIRLGAVLLLLLWCAIIFAGRWIAYAPV